MKRSIWVVLVIMWSGTGLIRATETENLGIQILPAPGKVVVDGKVNDWDLSGGLFAPGVHTFSVAITLSDGSVASDTATWQIEENHEP